MDSWKKPTCASKSKQLRTDQQALAEQIAELINGISKIQEIIFELQHNRSKYSTSESGKIQLMTPEVKDYCPERN